jgi:transcriptional regulator with XRE-family HTH domain
MSMAGRMLRRARRRAGLTQRQLAAEAGIPQETIARIEAGRVDPRLRTLDRLLEACGFGLEVEPRLGIGVDRTLFDGPLALTEPERARVFEQSNRNVLELFRTAKRSR